MNWSNILEISEEDPDEYLKNLVDSYSRSRIMQYGMNPVWLYSIPRPVQRIKRKQQMVNYLARMNKRNKIGSWYNSLNRV